MSHKSKKAVEALRDYLGRDAAGVKLLGDVSREMNDLRKRGNDERDRADAAESALQTLQCELLRLQSLVESKEADASRERSRARQAATALTLRDKEIASLKKAIGDGDAQTSDAEQRSGWLRDSDCIDAFNALRRDLPRCPVVANIPKGRVRATELSDVIQGFGGSEMIKLGRYVACRALFRFPVAIVSNDVTLSQNTISNDKVMSRFLRWFKTNMEETVPAVPIAKGPRGGDIG